MKRPIVGQPGYHITVDGRVWSDKTSKYLTPHGGGGRPGKRYPFVHTRPTGRSVNTYIHRAVADAFFPFAGIKAGLVVRHLDDDTWNNHANNLAWGTGSDNADDARRNGSLLGNPRHREARLGN